ncbi:MAG: polysaccharide deacetylase family protein, partial [Chloroflexi bacterium]|nr:polysaccharide deacetylase family protein [Chloroflexota bacterium]
RALLYGLTLILVWGGVSTSASAVPLTATEHVAVRVPILVYHAVDESGNRYSVTPRQLNEQCRWLVENGYTAITLGQFWDAATGFGTLPPNPIVLTNDDGWSSAMTFAEVLGRHGLPGTYFINSVSPLTPDQILTLAQWGAVEAHTVTHAHLAGMDYESQLAEIVQNKTYLEQITGQPIRFLAWPFGESNESAVQAAAAAGIVGAFGLGGTAADLSAINPYQVPRIMMMVEDDLTMFAAKVGGW